MYEFSAQHEASYFATGLQAFPPLHIALAFGVFRLPGICRLAQWKTWDSHQEAGSDFRFIFDDVPFPLKVINIFGFSDF